MSQVATAKRITEQINAGTLPAGLQFTPTRLILPDTLSYDEWLSVGAFIRLLHTASDWYIGDWLAYGEHTYGEKYAQAVDATGLSVSSLQGRAYVSTNVAASERVEGLSVGHHAVVASEPPTVQAELLTAAKAEGLSVRQMRRQLYEARGREFGVCPSCGGDCEIVRNNGQTNYQRR